MTKLDQSNLDQKRLDAYLEGVKSVGISGHVHPDGDSIGAVLAVYKYIRTYYPDIEADAYAENFPEELRFLDEEREVLLEHRKEITYDLFISVDCSDESRLGDALPYFKEAKQQLAIDHHISNDGFAAVNVIEPKTCSTCEILYGMLDPEKITKDIAECLYVGIVTDTGMFQYEATTAKTMRIAGELMDQGIDYPRIADRVFFSKTFSQLQAQGLAFSESHILFEGKVICAVVYKKDLDRLHLNRADLDGVVSAMRSVDGVEVALFMYEMDDGSFKLSLRSAAYVDVTAIAQVFGGGGHIRAAGATVQADKKGNIEDVLKQILEEIRKVIWTCAES